MPASRRTDGTIQTCKRMACEDMIKRSSSRSVDADSITRDGGPSRGATYAGRPDAVARRAISRTPRRGDPLLLDEAPAERFGHGRRSVGRAELLEDVLEVSLDGVWRDVQTLGDVAVGVAEREKLQHLDLASGERLGAAVAFLRLGELLGEGDEEVWVDHHVPAGDQSNCLDEVLGVSSLQHVATSARTNRLDDELP